jgi:hypothetical protein
MSLNKYLLRRKHGTLLSEQSSYCVSVYTYTGSFWKDSSALITYNYRTTQQTLLYVVCQGSIILGECAAPNGNAMKQQSCFHTEFKRCKPFLTVSLPRLERLFLERSCRNMSQSSYFLVRPLIIWRRRKKVQFWYLLRCNSITERSLPTPLSSSLTLTKSNSCSSIAAASYWIRLRIIHHIVWSSSHFLVKSLLQSLAIAFVWFNWICCSVICQKKQESEQRWKAELMMYVWDGC